MFLKLVSIQVLCICSVLGTLVSSGLIPHAVAEIDALLLSQLVVVRVPLLIPLEIFLKSIDGLVGMLNHLPC